MLLKGLRISLYFQVNNKSDKRIGGVYVMFDQWLEFKAAGHKEKTSELVSFFIRWLYNDVLFDYIADFLCK